MHVTYLFYRVKVKDKYCIFPAEVEVAGGAS